MEKRAGWGALMDVLFPARYSCRPLNEREPHWVLNARCSQLGGRPRRVPALRSALPPPSLPVLAWHFYHQQSLCQGRQLREAVRNLSCGLGRTCGGSLALALMWMSPLASQSLLFLICRMGMTTRALRGARESHAMNCSFNTQGTGKGAKGSPAGGLDSWLWVRGPSEEALPGEGGPEALCLGLAAEPEEQPLLLRRVGVSEPFNI